MVRSFCAAAVALLSLCAGSAQAASGLVACPATAAEAQAFFDGLKDVRTTKGEETPAPRNRVWRATNYWPTGLKVLGQEVQSFESSRLETTLSALYFRFGGRVRGDMQRAMEKAYDADCDGGGCTASRQTQGLGDLLEASLDNVGDHPDTWGVVLSCKYRLW